ncbi:DUF805 domain-containing protein [Endomicrobium proavitum]|uniref:DUF805 domain-containing protein n=1 Tax=Endomicrobium proavitum TaxID=1408281 RepID=A0A0G3WLB7_9BACT|nr:DUF805 domain-containing protein [Endomicrobium proavitum]AKL98662.1 membrane protein of unknown function [Endomicrobium proavitum]
MEYFLEAFKKFADFKSRASRRECWTFAFFNIFFIQLFVTVALILLNFRIGSSLGQDVPAIFAIGVGVLGFLYLLFVLIPGLAIVVRRLHDIGKSGAYIFVSLIPFIGGIWLFILLLLGSQEKKNQYGERAKETTLTTPSSINLIVLSAVWIALFLGFGFNITALIIPIAALVAGILFYKSQDTKNPGIVLAAASAIVIILNLQTFSQISFVSRVPLALELFSSIALLWLAISWIQRKKVYAASSMYAVMVAISLLNSTVTFLPNISRVNDSLYMIPIILRPLFLYLLAGFLLPVKTK